MTRSSAGGRRYRATVDRKMSRATSSSGMAVSKEPPHARTVEENDTDKYPKPPSERKKVVVVGLGMVGIAFMLAILAG